MDKYFCWNLSNRGVFELLLRRGRLGTGCGTAVSVAAVNGCRDVTPRLCLPCLQSRTGLGREPDKIERFACGRATVHIGRAAVSSDPMRLALAVEDKM